MKTTAENSRAVSHISAGRRVLEIESKAIQGLVPQIDEDFATAVEQILSAKGRVIVSGMGKSGIIGHKIAATLMSTGTPSFYMHPGEAYHGDLGMVTNEDIFIAISNSGETDEIIKLLPFLGANGNFLIAMTGDLSSTLARTADCKLDVSVEREACPLQLAPTASTTATLAMGDALAVAVMEARGFSPDDFARFHPGGALGRRLLSRVRDQIPSERPPLISADAEFLDVLESITRGQMGLALVESVDGHGIITDGDLRRAIESHRHSVFELTARDLMTTTPATVSANTLMADAIEKMERLQVSALLVTDTTGVVGVVKK